MGGLKADLVVPGIGGDKGEFSGGGTALGHDAVIGIKDFVDKYEDFEVGIEDVAVEVGVVLFGFVVSWGLVSFNCATAVFNVILQS